MSLQGELCDASEEAQREAEWQATGRISCASNPVPFSCSAAGSSADPLEPPQGSQLGTILEQAAAIIGYSQVVPNNHTSTAKGRLSIPGWLSQAAHQAEQTQLGGKPEALAHASSQTASAAAAGGTLQSLPNKPDADANPDAAADADAGAAATTASAVRLPAQGDQETGHSDAAPASPPAALQSAASQPQAVQGLAQLHSAPVPASLTDATGTHTKAAVDPASESQTQAGDLKSAAVLQDAPTQQAAQKSAAADSKQAPAAVPAVEANPAADDSMSQETEDLEDIAPTEVQLPDHASLLHAATAQTQRSPAPVVAPAATAGRQGNSTESPQAEARSQADAGAHAQLPVRAEAGNAQAAPVQELPAATQQMLPGSPTQDLHLHLQLSYMEPELADHHAGHAGDDHAGGHAGRDHAGPAGDAASQQLCLQLATEPPMPEAHAEHAVRDESWRAGVGSPAGLDLNLDTQVPEQANADKAGSVCAAVGGHKSPALNRGWWAQPWSAAQHAQPAEDAFADSFPTGLPNTCTPPNSVCIDKVYMSVLTVCICCCGIYHGLRCTKTAVSLSNIGFSNPP